MSDRDVSGSIPTAVRIRACALMEEIGGRPSYLATDEVDAEAYAQAWAEYRRGDLDPPKLSPLAEAVRKAEGKNPTPDEIAESIGFLNRVSNAIRKATS